MACPYLGHSDTQTELFNKSLGESDWFKSVTKRYGNSVKLAVNPHMLFSPSTGAISFL